jgi:hypothetical protein
MTKEVDDAIHRAALEAGLFVSKDDGSDLTLNPEARYVTVMRFARAIMRKAELKTIEDTLLTISEPVGMACCGHPADDHGYVCCGNGDPDFRTMQEVEKVLEGWRDKLIGEKEPA